MKILAPFLLILLVGCDAPDVPEITHYENALKVKLKAPASYKRVSAHAFGFPSSNPTEQHVLIEFDAVNDFDVPLRSAEACVYPIRGGKIDFNVPNEAGARAADAEALASDIEAAANVIEKETIGKR